MSQLIISASFPPMFLDMIDFESWYNDEYGGGSGGDHGESSGD